MLSDEEKKAIKYFYNLRATIDESVMLFDEDINIKCGKETIKQITILLNLIEKQQKEIEELKEVKWYYEISRVPKDKIKAKIEELENEHTGCTTNVFSVLQSLLEKE